ncbi:MAG: integrase arm-type DNA-binding domain-containing protein, partial [Ectothiorhodospiraceae bacterium]
MARETNKLTVKQVEAATYTDRAYKMADGGGLTLSVQEQGKYWWFRYRFGGKEKTISFGRFPETPLKRARELRDEARNLVNADVDPSANRRALKAARAEASENTFEVIALEWFEVKHQLEVVPDHASRNLRRLEKYAFPALAKRPVADIQPQEVLLVLKGIVSKGHIETAHRVKALIGQVFRYAVSTSRAERDITADLRDALPSAKEKHHPAITDVNELRSLLQVMDSYSGQPSTTAALRLAPI